MTPFSRLIGLDAAVQWLIVGVAGLLILGAMGFAAHQWSQRVAVEKQLSELTDKHDKLVEKNGRCEVESKGLQVQLEDQTKRVTAYENEAAERIRRAEEALRKAEDAARAGYRKADEVARGKRLAEDECTSMKLRADRSVREFQEKAK